MFMMLVDKEKPDCKMTVEEIRMLTRIWEGSHRKDWRCINSQASEGVAPAGDKWRETTKMASICNIKYRGMVKMGVFVGDEETRKTQDEQKLTWLCERLI